MWWARSRSNYGNPKLPDVFALVEAGAEALAAMVTRMQGLYDVDRGTATALAGAVVDLRVTQVANETWGVHAVLAHGAIR